MASAWCNAMATSSISKGLTISASRSSRAAPAKRDKHEHAGIGRVLGRDILLGHEIHPVTQGRDQPDPRQTQIAGRTRREDRFK